MINEFIVANSGIFVLVIVGVIAYVISIYIRAKIEQSMKAPKSGTKKGCEDCVAMQTIAERIPKIEVKQEDLRKTDLPDIANNITLLKAEVEDMQDNISKLFNLIEQSWLAQINRLETALHKSMCIPYDSQDYIHLQPRRSKDAQGGKSKRNPKAVPKPKSRTKKGGGK